MSINTNYSTISADINNTLLGPKSGYGGLSRVGCYGKRPLSMTGGLKSKKKTNKKSRRRKKYSFNKLSKTHKHKKNCRHNKHKHTKYCKHKNKKNMNKKKSRRNTRKMRGGHCGCNSKMSGGNGNKCMSGYSIDTNNGGRFGNLANPPSISLT
tara:strand:+ start:118 stop:576 length:459 start_codon:yes stop_codon:yes gene_type:complete